MANRSMSIGGCLGVIALALFTFTGCTSQPPQERGAPQQPMLVEALPPPNFDGPDLADRAPVPRPAVSVPLLPHDDRDLSGIPREWLPMARANTWKWIVIHHSATPTGGAMAFDKIHKAKGWDELGYHFVIGNGTDTRDGQVEVGPRWPPQKWGAHAKTPDNQYNDFGIGICLVGNFDLTRPTDSQVKSLSKLVAHLMRTYHIPADRVVGHSDTGRATDCPGRLMNVAQVRRLSVQILVDAGEPVAPDTGIARTASVDLLTDSHH